MNKSLVILGAIALVGCSSTTSIKKTIIDESGSKPSWVDKSRTVWEDDGKVYFKSTQQVKGNERLSACYDLAKLNSKSALISEIQESIKGALDSHEATLSENAEILLSKSRSADFEGKISGLRFTEEYFMRYTIGSDERIDCFELSQLSKDDYDKIKRSILFKVEEADPRIKEQIAKKHIEFFSKDKSKTDAKEE